MREQINDDFYNILREYNRTVIDYCLMESDSSDLGLLCHKEAVEFAMNRLKEQYPWISVDMDKAAAEEISQEELLYFPDEPWKEASHGTTVYHVDFKQKGKIPYWYAFLEPPHGTGPVIVNGKMVREKYGREDFEIINHALFPKGFDELEVYEWSTDWSSYFEEGLEWWGTLCCSIYDRKMNRYVVIMASSTD